jgi:UDP-N-acetylglucosamine diphosphorylase/glucosamine-1-phosphate N-acetyltransferase
MQIILSDAPQIWANLHPLTLTRPVGELRIGILTIAEKWEKYLNSKVYFQTANYLQPKYPLPQGTSDDALFINSSICPNPALVEEVLNLQVGQKLMKGNLLIAYRGQNHEIQSQIEFTYIQELWDIFRLNGQEIEADFHLITKNRDSQVINDSHVILYHPERIFIEEGASLKACILDAEKGYIYIGKNADIQIGAMIQGNFSLGEGATVSLGAKMRPNTTIGPFCKVGGEISNSVIWGYSNKAHDGFLGNSVIGAWCNLGADTNTSNLKNNYGTVKIWNYPLSKFVSTQIQFCGLIMGDHSKAGINTMFNTGTVVGVSANIFGAGFPPKYIPSYAWGGAAGIEQYDWEKAIDVAQKVVERRGLSLDQIEIDILRQIFENKV